MPVRIDDLQDDLIRAASNRVKRRAKRIDKSLQSIAKGFGLQTETDARLNKFESREADLAGSQMTLSRDSDFGLERKIGKSNDLLSYEFLEQGMLAGFSVGLIDVEPFEKQGTGFFIAPNIVLTNHHVLSSEDEALAGNIELGFEDNRIKTIPAPLRKSLQFDPATFYVANEEFDYAFVAVDLANTTEDVSWLPLIEEQGKIAKTHPVNLIQHPDGRRKQLVVHNSHLLDIEDGGPDERFCWYTSDTEPGSSGSPVFNNRWEVIALHHKAIPKVNKNNEILDIHGKTMNKERFKESQHLVDWFANEGIRVSRLVESFRSAECSPEHGIIRDRILTLWRQPGARQVGLRTGWLDD